MITQEYLQNANHQELFQLQNDINRTIKEREKALKRDARNAIQKVAKDFGMTLEQIIGTTKEVNENRKYGTVAVKYRNPNNEEQTWTGRGKKPRWLNEMLAAGSTLESFRVQ